MNQRVGTCSLCGGDVMGFRGPWFSVTPPPPDRCSGCGAVSRGDVIDMVPSHGGRVTTTYTTTDTSYVPKGKESSDESLFRVVMDFATRTVTDSRTDKEPQR